jgi:hypothetical protein
MAVFSTDNRVFRDYGIERMRHRATWVYTCTSRHIDLTRRLSVGRVKRRVGSSKGAIRRMGDEGWSSLPAVRMRTRWHHFVISSMRESKSRQYTVCASTNHPILVQPGTLGDHVWESRTRVFSRPAGDHKRTFTCLTPDLTIWGLQPFFAQHSTCRGCLFVKETEAG